MATTVVFFDGRIGPHHHVTPQSRPVHFRRRKVAGFAPGLRAAMRLQTWMGGAGLALLATSDAFAAASVPSGPSEVIFFAQVGILLVVGRLLGEAMQRIGQPAVMGQLVAGIVLGPSVLGVLWPDLQHAIFPESAEQKSMIDAVSQLGILMLLLLTGMETDLKLVRRVGRAAITVSAVGVAVPFACGVALGEMLPDWILPKPDARFITSIFLGTALSISSVKIVAMVVREMNFMRRNLGQIIVASAILEDSIGWIIIAIAFGLASSGTLDAWSAAKIVLGTIAFLAASLTIGRRIVFSLIRWANDNFVSDFPVITTILVIMVSMALTTHMIGVHSVLGAFVAGVLVGESPILTRHIDEQLRGLIVALFMPVFFGLSGLSTDLTVLKNTDVLLLTGALVLIASIGKFGGAFIGGKLGRLSQSESLALACGMNARGSTEVIVATVGLSMGVLNQNLFTMIVAMAVITTMAMPPMLRWALARIPLGADERFRLEREELDAKGFVPNLERLLLAADDSANGKFASRLAGLIAGSGAKPITVLDLRKGISSKKSGPGEEGHEEAIKSAAETVTTLEAHSEEVKQGSVHVTTRSKKATAHEAVAGEAHKGYDLLVIGIENTRTPTGDLTKEVTRIADGFEGALAVVAAHGPHIAQALQSRSKILVPVNGTEVSRRAVEIALVVARSNDARITALYVTSGTQNSTRKRPRRSSASRRNEEAVLKEVTELADRYDVKVRTAMRVDVAAEDAIRKEARRGDYDLVILGVTRRPGETLSFGNMAAAVLESSDISVLFIAG
ncbi:MAG TPA: cation:proton antiporter [Xanthobacteraceae bacterium]|nr:cation:proton antiporter [Xanthobacteraceae bacterium]